MPANKQATGEPNMAKKRVDFVITEKGAGKAKKGFQDVDRSMASAAKSAAKYAAAYIGVSGIIRLTKASIEAFGIQEQAEKRLETALGGVNKELLKQASALQQVTTFGDEAIIGVQASIAAFTDNTQEIKEATKATLDFAIANGFDLKSAGDLVAKTLGSSTNALTRYGVEVTGAVGSTERLTTLTEGIARLWGGQAAAAADTMAGSMTQAKNAMGDVAEVMGESLSPVITEAAIAMRDLAMGYQEFLNMTKGNRDRLETDIERLDEINILIKDRTLSEAEFVKLMAEKKGILMALADQSSALLRIDEASLIVTAKKIELLKDESKIVNDLRTDYQKFGGEALEGSLKALAMSQNLGEASRALANQYIVEGVFGAVKGAMTSVPFPLNLLAAGGAAIAANALFNSIVPVQAAATGADFVTNGTQMLMVGDNPSGRERVQVTPMGGDPNINGPQGNTFIFGDINGLDEYTVEQLLIPAINRATSQGRAAIA